MHSSIYLLFALVAVVTAETPTKTKVSASIKDTSVSGLEGFNVNLAAPFKINDFIVGFNYKLGNLNKLPETLFAKKTFDTVGDGSATVEANFNLEDNALDVATKWDSDKYGLSLNAEANTNDKLKSVGFEKDVDFDGNKVTLVGSYNLLKKKLFGSAKVNVDKGSAKLSYDTENQDPSLEVSYDVDSSNSIAPELSLKTGSIAYGWNRKWTGGSLKTKLYPGDKVAFEWKDDGASGSWTTKAEVPLEDQSKTKVTFNRDWNY
eukprot:gene8366-11320_t